MYDIISEPYRLEGSNMKKTLFIRKLLALSLALLFVSLIPLPSFISPLRGTMVQASSEEEEDPIDVKLNVKTLSLVTEKSYKLRIRNSSDSQKVYFKSKDSSIASIVEKDDKFASITGVSVGTTTIIATVKEGFKTVETLECEVTVGPPAISVKFTKDNVRVELNKRCTLITILKPNNTTEVPKFTSSDSSVAMVSSTGKIYAKSVGTVEITASISNGKTASCYVTVIPLSLLKR